MECMLLEGLNDPIDSFRVGSFSRFCIGKWLNSVLQRFKLAQLLCLCQGCPLPQKPLGEAFFHLFGAQFQDSLMDLRMNRGEAQYLPYPAGRKSGGFCDVNRLDMRVGGSFRLPVQSRFKEVFAL